MVNEWFISCWFEVIQWATVYHLLIRSTLQHLAGWSHAASLCLPSDSEIWEWYEYMTSRGFVDDCETALHPEAMVASSKVWVHKSARTEDKKRHACKQATLQQSSSHRVDIVVIGGPATRRRLPRRRRQAEGGFACKYFCVTLDHISGQKQLTECWWETNNMHVQARHVDVHDVYSILQYYTVSMVSFCVRKPYSTQGLNGFGGAGRETSVGWAAQGMEPPTCSGWM